jgi:hypothetical protein
MDDASKGAVLSKVPEVTLSLKSLLRRWEKPAVIQSP